MKTYQNEFPTEKMASVLGVSRSGYYRFLQEKPSQRAQENESLLEKIKVIHETSYETYGSPRVHAELVALGEMCSRQRVANAYDNAVAESFFYTLKTEWVHFYTYKNLEEATMSIFQYVFGFYNQKRRHSTLGYLSPAQFESNFLNN